MVHGSHPGPVTITCTACGSNPVPATVSANAWPAITGAGSVATADTVGVVTEGTVNDRAFDSTPDDPFCAATVNDPAALRVSIAYRIPADLGSMDAVSIAHGAHPGPVTTIRTVCKSK